VGSFIAKPGVRLVSDSGAASRPQCKPSAASGLVYACTFSCALGGIGFSMMGWYSLYLLWLSPWTIMTRIRIVMVMMLIINSAFLATTALRSFYGGALADEHGGVPSLPNGWDPNLTVVIATLLLLSLTGWLSNEKKNGSAF